MASNFPNQGTVYLEGNPVKMVSLLTGAATPQNSPKVINGSEREQIILCDPLTGLPLDLEAGGGSGGSGTVKTVNGQSPDGSGAVSIASTNLTDSAALARLNSAQQTEVIAGATTALLNAGKSALKDPAGGADIPLGGNTATTWQTYTPSATNTVHIAIDRATGPNVMLGAPADNTQVVDVPLNCADGAEMQINLVGGGGSGSWTTWTSGSPTTPGFVFLAGVAPTAPSLSANYLPVYVKRRGVKYECLIGTSAVV